MSNDMKGARFKHPSGDRRTLGGANAEREAAQLKAMGWEQIYPVDYNVEPSVEEPEKKPKSPKTATTTKKAKTKASPKMTRNDARSKS